MTVLPGSAENKGSAFIERASLAGYGEIGVIASFWVFVAILTIVQETFDPRYDRSETWNRSEALFTFLKYMVWVVITPGIFRLVRWKGLESHTIRRLLMHGAVGVVVAGLVHFVYHLLWNALVPDSPQAMSVLFVFRGLHFFPEFLLYLVVLAAGLARDYFFRYRERLHETARLRAESAELRADAAELQAGAAELNAQLADARLQSLYMQINPHFLFNTLHTINAYVERDPEGVRQIITHLGELLRYVLEKADVKEVPLEQELGFINRYLDIQTIRFQDQLHVDRHIDPEACGALVPSLILQPLVENAVRHGVGALDTAGCIELRAWRDGDRLHLSVRDNGPGFPPGMEGDVPADGPGIGLENTRKRLASLYRDAQGLVLENRPEGGAEVHITLPYHLSTAAPPAPRVRPPHPPDRERRWIPPER